MIVYLLIALLAVSNICLLIRTQRSSREIGNLISVCGGLLDGLGMAADTIHSLDLNTVKKPDE